MVWLILGLFVIDDERLCFVLCKLMFFKCLFGINGDSFMFDFLSFFVLMLLLSIIIFVVGGFGGFVVFLILVKFVVMMVWFGVWGFCVVGIIVVLMVFLFLFLF